MTGRITTTIGWPRSSTSCRRRDGSMSRRLSSARMPGPMRTATRRTANTVGVDSGGSGEPVAVRRGVPGGMVLVDGLDGYLAASTLSLASRGDVNATIASRFLGILVVMFSFGLGGAELAGYEIGHYALPLGLMLFAVVIAIRIWARSGWQPRAPRFTSAVLGPEVGGRTDRRDPLRSPASGLLECVRSGRGSITLRSRLRVSPEGRPCTEDRPGVYAANTSRRPFVVFGPRPRNQARRKQKCFVATSQARSCESASA